MKNIYHFYGGGIPSLPKFFVCFVMLLCTTALFAQNETKITINVRNATIKEVLEVIRKHDYRLVYTTADVDAYKNKVTMNLNNVTAAQVLNRAFEGTTLTYRVDGNLITIRKADKVERLTVSGVVKDERGRPLEAVTVLIKGTLSGTPTNKEGKFEIRANKGATLLFNYIGMVPNEIEVLTEAPMAVTMKEAANSVEDVVITGYQIINKRESTSAITTLKAEDIIEPVGISLDNMLQGKVAGMAVMQQTSTINAAPKIRIRGTSTIIGNREPLWVLDGVVLTDPVKLDATELNSMDKVNLIGNAISGLNPEDIDRIDVLKDASATALYGSKAANGVIVITTKRGKFGPPSVRYSTAMNFVARPTYDKMFRMNSNDRMEVSEEMHMRGLEFNGYTPKNVGYEGALQRLWANEITTDQFYSDVKSMKEQNTDWFKLLFRNSFSHSHTLSVSGATDRLDYYASVGYANQQGAKLQEDGDRFSFMTNLGFKVSDRFKVSLQVAANVSTTNRPTEDLFEYAHNTSRAISAYNPDGSYMFYDAEQIKATPIPIPLTYNVFNEIENSGSTHVTRNINTNVNMNYKIASWISANAILSYNSSSSIQEKYKNERTLEVAKLRGLPYGFDMSRLTANELENYKEKLCALPFGGLLESQNDTADTYFMRASVNANKLINKHSLSFGVGFEATTAQANGYMREDYGYLPERGKLFASLDNIKDYPHASSVIQSLVPTITDSRNNNISYYSLASYSYDSRYIVSANIRGEASNKFGRDKSARFMPIWSVSGRWNITDEKWFEPVLPYISSLGIRSSYGIQGNVTDAHNPNMVISLGTVDTNAAEYKAALVSLPNHGLRWEKTHSFNVGIDFSLFNGRLSGGFDYYSKESKDQLLPVTIETTNGAKSVTINGGELVNTGWDLTIMAKLIETKKFSWSMTLTSGKVKNSINNAAPILVTYKNYLGGTVIRNGFPLNSFYSYRFGGLDEKGLPTYNGVAEKDADGKVLFKNIDEAFASALVYSGKREADFNGGFSTFFKYKSLSLNMMFAFSLGSKVRLNDLYTDGDNFKLPYPHINMSSDFNDRWRKPGDEAFTTIPTLTDEFLSLTSKLAPTYGRQIAANYWQMYNNSDHRVISGNFMRCRSISLSYNFDKSIAQALHLRGLSMGFSVSNPFVIKSKGLKGRDPEQVTMGSGSIPPQRHYAFTMNLNF